MPEQTPKPDNQVRQPTPDIGSPKEVKLTPADLARSWLGHRGAEVHRQIASTESSLKFNRTYEPTAPRTGPGSDAGMDISDWQNEVLEYQQWPEEREELIEHGETELERLQDEAAILGGQVGRVNRGDTQLIGRFAKLETERRARIEDQKRMKEEQREGVVFEGTEEAIRQVQELQEADRQGAWKKGATPNGWHKAYSSTQGYIYVYKPGEGALGGDVATISVRVGDPAAYQQGTPKDLLHINYKDLSEMRAQRVGNGVKVENEGLGLYFNLNTRQNKVTGHLASPLRPEVQFNGTVEVKSSGGDYPRMTQEHFNKFRTHLRSLVEGVRDTT